MIEDLNDRFGGSICNTHLVGSQALSNLIQNQNLQDTWRKMNPHKSEFTYIWIQSNMHSRLDRIYATKNINVLYSKIIPFQHSDHDALITEFILRAGLRGPGYWKLRTSNSPKKFLVRLATTKTFLWHTIPVVGNRKNVPKNLSYPLFRRNAKKYKK